MISNLCDISSGKEGRVKHLRLLSGKDNNFG
jgi:hypothetical protein